MVTDLPGNRAVIALGCDGVLRARLGELPIPGTRDGFACRQVELEFPVRQRSRARIGDRVRGNEAVAPVRRHRVRRCRPAGRCRRGGRGTRRASGFRDVQQLVRHGAKGRRADRLGDLIQPGLRPRSEQTGREMPRLGRSAPDISARTCRTRPQIDTDTSSAAAATTWVVEPAAALAALSVERMSSKSVAARLDELRISY